MFIVTVAVAVDDIFVAAEAVANVAVDYIIM